MEQHTIEQMLRQILELEKKNRISHSQKTQRGENFNVFNVLGLWSEEVRLHSAFLAEFMNPKGMHGLGPDVLRYFIREATGEFSFNAANADVEVEKSIGEVNQTYDEGGRIDIFLSDNEGNLIIVENKVYAGDQPHQLYRYYRYAHDNQKARNFIILYLTLDGHQPSEDSLTDSTGHNRVDETKIRCISYREHIQNWLSALLPLSYDKPYVRETLPQYITLINQLTEPPMTNEELLAITNDPKHPDNVYAALAIISNASEIKKRAIIDHVIPSLKNAVEDLGKQQQYHHLSFSLKGTDADSDWKKSYPFTCYNGMYSTKFFVDVTRSENETVRIEYYFFKYDFKELTWGISNEGTSSSIQRRQLPVFVKNVEENFPFGKADSVLNSWSNPENFRKAMDGTFADEMTGNIQTVIEQLGWA